MLRLWGINGTLVNKTCVESEITCLAYTTAPEGVYVNVIATGMKEGSIRYILTRDTPLNYIIVGPHKVKYLFLIQASLMTR